MKDTNANVVICGAGIAGIAAAYYLTQHGIDGILLVDQNTPLSLTSDKSTEAYRNWWPGPDGAMVALMNRSIDLIENLALEHNNVFHLNRRGYVYATSDAEHISEFRSIAEQVEILGAGPMRVHKGVPGDPDYIPHHESNFTEQPIGSDLILDLELIRKHFPYISMIKWTRSIYVKMDHLSELPQKSSSMQPVPTYNRLASFWTHLSRSSANVI
jgi:hypothetical protein